MKITTPILWLIAAAAAFTVAVKGDSQALAFAAFFLGGIGAGTLFPALKERWQSERPEVPEASRLTQLEERLRVTEDELASATREMNTLREQHEFDRRLLAKPEKYDER